LCKTYTEFLFVYKELLSCGDFYESPRFRLPTAFVMRDANPPVTLGLRLECRKRRGHITARRYFCGGALPFADDFEGLAEAERKNLGLDPIKGLQHEDIRVHEKNWFDCIRSGKQPNANIDLAIRVQTVICLAEMSERLSAACLFDEKTRKVTTADGKALQPLTYGATPLS
jgi:hypothetical protein